MIRTGIDGKRRGRRAGPRGGCGDLSSSKRAGRRVAADPSNARRTVGRSRRQAERSQAAPRRERRLRPWRLRDLTVGEGRWAGGGEGSGRRRRAENSQMLGVREGWGGVSGGGRGRTWLRTSDPASPPARGPPGHLDTWTPGHLDTVAGPGIQPPRPWPAASGPRLLTCGPCPSAPDLRLVAPCPCPCPPTDPPPWNQSARGATPSRAHWSVHAKRPGPRGVRGPGRFDWWAILGSNQ
ncbi:hypothetical protein SMA5143A_1943 [Streptomyces sp. MA5143a]|nr:hypothetical protein SMA5143A_1943 [Streptomyces sp. MA5143a]